MQLRFEQGDSQAPRGHAILFAHLGNQADHVIATYCVVLPIQFSIGKYLPPILSGQMPMEGLREASAMSVVPIPPMLEDAPSLAALRQLAERRADDLCDLGTLFITDDGQRMTFAAEACAEYGEIYNTYVQRWPRAVEPSEPSVTPLDEMSVEDVVTDMLPERDRLGEIARLIGQAQYAMEGNDKRLLDEVTLRLRRIARSLPEKYRADLMVDAALHSDTTSARLAQLYLQRAYKLLDEEYADIPPIEQQIRALREEHGEGE